MAENSPVRGGFSYPVAVVFNVIRRLVTVLVLCFAVLGFLAVPIGDKTGYEHARQLSDTPGVQKVLDGLRDAMGTVDEEVSEEVGEIGAMKETR